MRAHALPFTKCAARVHRASRQPPPDGNAPNATQGGEFPLLHCRSASCGAPLLVQRVYHPLQRVLVRGVLVAKVVPQAGESGRAHAAERVAVCAVRVAAQPPAAALLCKRTTHVMIQYRRLQLRSSMYAEYKHCAAHYLYTVKESTEALQGAAYSSPSCQRLPQRRGVQQESAVGTLCAQTSGSVNSNKMLKFGSLLPAVLCLQTAHQV